MLFNKKVVATHDQGFHADDVFAVATLKMCFGKLKVHRTRDIDLILKADIVVDVGRVYDPEKLRFDHHQEGGAGERGNNIPYASFGLVWKHFGKEVSGSLEIAELVDRHLVCAVDAIDNGVELTVSKIQGVSDYSVSSVIGALNPTELESKKNIDDLFLKAVDLAEVIIQREISQAKAILYFKDEFKKSVQFSADKRYVILEKEMSRQVWQQFTSEFKELLFVVVPRGNTFALRAIRENPTSFKNRKDLPESWAGKSDKELEAVSGVLGAIFCHNKRFVATASSKEAILKMLQIALSNN